MSPGIPLNAILRDNRSVNTLFGILSDIIRSTAFLNLNHEEFSNSCLFTCFENALLYGSGFAFLYTRFCGGFRRRF